jgi:putative flippase GtrA
VQQSVAGKDIRWEFARYVVVGLANTLVSLMVIFGLLLVTGMSPYAANAAGYAAGLVSSYLLNRRWTFRSDRPHASAIPHFVAVFLVSYACNLVTVKLTIDAIGGFSQVAAAIVYVVVSFAGNRVFAFASWNDRQE